MSHVPQRRWQFLPSLPPLEVLHLLGNRSVTDSVIEHIAALANLQELDLRRTGITDTGLRHLHEAKQLQSLNISSNRKLSQQAVTRLREALPKCAVVSDFPGSTDDDLQR